MKCRTCGQPAAIHMRQHKLALCAVHYLEWLPAQVDRFIGKYRMFDAGHRVLVAVSGGKDSLSLWDILQRLGYQADGLYIGLGIDAGLAYSQRSRQIAEQFAAQRGLILHVVDMPNEYGRGIPDFAGHTRRGQARPCSVCGMSKRHIMNRVAQAGGYDVLATGHNLDDESAVLLGNTLNWLGSYLARQNPVLEAERAGLARKVKPLCRIGEREMAAYALLRGIEYIYDECPFSTKANTIYYKQMLNRLEHDRPGSKLNFYLGFLQAKEDGYFPMQASPEYARLHACPNCGQPTSAPELCSFCQMTVAR